MSCKTHEGHEHKHGEGCGHTAVKHGEHVDYVHDGHLHHDHDGHVDECSLPVDSCHTSACTADHSCEGHEAAHVHGEGCGHEGVPHGDHVDYIVNGHLHNPCKGHCDNHGSV